MSTRPHIRRKAATPTRDHHGIAPGTHAAITLTDAAKALETAGGNKAKAARALGMSTRTFQRKLDTRRDTEQPTPASRETLHNPAGAPPSEPLLGSSVPILWTPGQEGTLPADMPMTERAATATATCAHCPHPAHGDVCTDDDDCQCDGKPKRAPARTGGGDGEDSALDGPAAPALGPDADEEVGNPVPAPPADEGTGFTGGRDNPLLRAMTPAPVSAQATTCNDCPHADHPGRPCEADGECFCGTDLKGRLGNEAA